MSLLSRILDSYKIYNDVILYNGVSLNLLTITVIVFTFSQRLDRAWYDMDSGYDETHNPFADVSEEYTKKKEENMAKKAVKRMSAQQRQINKVYTQKVTSIK